MSTFDLGTKSGIEKTSWLLKNQRDSIARKRAESLIPRSFYEALDRRSARNSADVIAAGLAALGNRNKTR